jgi:diguanylate cyclase (GGDEF)-like protein/PAS domain S-box-containing protein
MNDELRILFLEDIIPDVELTTRLLRKSGISPTIRWVETEVEFRKALQEFTPDIILSDFTFPSFDGTTALTIAQESYPDVPFIFVSGTIGEERAAQLLKGGATDYVLKTNLQRLVPVIRRALREAAERAARRKAEQALQWTKERLDSILASLRDVVWAVSVPGQELVYLNPAFEQVYQRPAAEFFTYPELWSRVIHPDDRDRVLKAWNEVFQGVPLDIQYRLLRPEGEPHWVLHCAHLILDDSGHPVRVDSLVSDITGRKHAEEALRQSEERFRLAADAVHAMVYDVSVAEGVASAAYGLKELLGYELNEVSLTYEWWWNQVHPDDRAACEAQFQDAIRHARDYVLQYRIRHQQGHYIVVEDNAKMVRDEVGRAVRLVRGVVDITERKQQEQRITRLTRIYGVSSGINAIIVRLRTRHELFQEACRIAVEYGKFRIACIDLWAPGTATLQLVACAGLAEGDRDKVQRLIAEDVQQGQGPLAGALKEKQPAICNDTKTDCHVGPWGRWADIGGYRSLIALPLVVGQKAAGIFMLFATDPGFFDDDELRLLRDLAADISFALEVIEKEEKLNYLAYYDALTGLPNRGLCYDRIDQLIHRTGENGAFAVLAIDLERFRLINYTFGRAAGDSLLKQVAERLKNAAAGTYTVARVGADYFAVVLTDVREESEIVHIFREKILAAITQPFTVNERPLRISARAGVVLFPNDGRDADTLCKSVEAAVKRAKVSGERLVFYTAQMQARIAERLALENDLRRAIEEEQFILYYQPQVDVEKRHITGFEALIRWNHPEKGLVPPAEFIPVLEETSMILEVGRWVLERAVSDFHHWKSKGLNPPAIQVNVSPIQLRQKDFVAQVRAVLDHHGGEGASVGLELTESVIMEDLEQSLPKLSAIRALGVGIAIDDFGTGFSSLSQLSKLPVSAVKIDRSFITEVASSPDSVSIVSIIVNLAHSLNLRVVAEGVETVQQAQLLKLLRCNEMQGFLFSQPLPPEQTESVLVKQTIPI